MIYLMMRVLPLAGTARLFDALDWLSRLSGTLAAALVLVFVLLMGAHLRERDADERET